MSSRTVKNQDEAIAYVMEVAGEACSEQDAAAVVALLLDRGLGFGDDWGQYIHDLSEGQWLAILDEAHRIAEVAS